MMESKMQELIERLQDPHRRLVVSDRQEAAEMLAVTETGYQAVTKKNDEMQAVMDQMIERMTDVGIELRILRAALSEISEDPTGVSSYQADIAKQALAGTYQPG